MLSLNHDFGFTETKSNQRAQREAGPQNVKFKFLRAVTGHELIDLFNTGEISKIKTE